MSDTASTSKREAYEAYRDGELSEEDAREFFGVQWEGIRQLARIEGRLARRPGPDAQTEDRHR